MATPSLGKARRRWKSTWPTCNAFWKLNIFSAPTLPVFLSGDTSFLNFGGGFVNGCRRCFYATPAPRRIPMKAVRLCRQTRLKAAEEVKHTGPDGYIAGMVPKLFGVSTRRNRLARVSEARR